MEFTPAQIDKRIESDPEMQALAQNDETEYMARHEQMYNKFGYNADGSPMSTAMKGIHKVSEVTGIPKDIVQGAANFPIPAALTTLGAASPIPGAASAMSVAGEFANHALGLRDLPGPVDIGVAAAAPLVGPMLSRAKSGLSNIGQGLPGAGKTMHQVAADTIAKQAAHMEVTDDMVNFMRQNFKNVPSFKADIPGVRAYVAQELSDVSKSLTLKASGKGASQKIVDPYIQKLNALQANLKNNTSFSFEQLMATEKSFIEKGVEDPNGIWRKLSGVMIDDLKAQANNPAVSKATRAKIQQGVDSYTQFVAVNTRKQGQAALHSMLNASVTQLDDGLVRFNKQAFLKKMDSDGMKVFEPSEIADMKKAISNLGYLGGTPKALTQVTHTGSYGAAGLATYSVGGVSGVVGLAAILGMVKLGLGTSMGRKVIEGLAKKGHGTVNALELKSMLGQITAGANAGAVAGVSGMGTKTTGVNPFPNEQ